MTTQRPEFDMNFHPSVFENQKSTPRLNLIQRKQLDFTSVDTVSPGSFKLTSDDKQISGSNTRHLFKNLYGETPLTFIFFSKDNIQNIQKLIRYNVYKEVNQVIDDQSLNELMIIMRSIFLEYHAHPPLFNENMSDSEKQKLNQLYLIEVKRLNLIVLNDILPRVLSGMQQYLDYLKDISKAPTQIERPAFENSRQRDYRSVTQVLLGSTL
jgi:hypothetical protein